MSHAKSFLSISLLNLIFQLEILQFKLYNYINWPLKIFTAVYATNHCSAWMWPKSTWWFNSKNRPNDSNMMAIDRYIKTIERDVPLIPNAIIILHKIISIVVRCGAGARQLQPPTVVRAGYFSRAYSHDMYWDKWNLIRYVNPCRINCRHYHAWVNTKYYYLRSWKSAIMQTVSY